MKLLFGLVTLSLLSSARVVLEPVKQAHIERTATKGYKATSRADPNHLLELSIAMKIPNEKLLESTLYRVSDPASSQYGQHLTFEETHALIAPEDKSLKVVMDWLQQHNITGIKANPSGSFINAVVTVSQAEKLLDTEYWTHIHEPSGKAVTRVLLNRTGTQHSYGVPPSVAEHVSFVAPTVTFPPSSIMTSGYRKRRAGLKEEPTPLVTPPILWKLYNITGIGKGTSSKISQGVASFLKQYYEYNDLKLFWKKYKMPGTGFSWTDVPKSQKHSPVGTEASLDVQWLSVSGQNINTEHWSTEGEQPGNPENEPFVAFLTKLSTTASPPTTFSISYGDEEDGVTESYAVRCSAEFQAAGVRGITLLAASGDSGVGCAVGKYVPTFPASCPYITGVGGLSGGSPGRSPTGESVAQLSGGGFSNYFARPPYQDSAVAAYTSHSLPDPGQWNHTGAGFPDIAAQALQFDTCTEGFFYPIDGTSCACPAASGVFSRLNQDRQDAGKKGLGWLNPMIYSGAPEQAGSHMFNDVLDGANDHCGAASGFPAATGWDACTGWGSPNYGKLKDYVLSLP
mmetsp:Transcript_49251/g.96610  ORF Transcript_49251/g.96610 Transcript_49251/m.96610 type:complete len:569 (+) Transcript_49251:28-1734(+)|eukprot:CAMPEP_0175181192 /NCGR_PEP_ID=MMETSP0087-20121206/36512_1 /TAXON_ID=136419 /ORGANISM="Unknown Unknown, Strain D1" /LENGTH=568 /DNA_ID=CAMNT_0016473667 /DNA_START=28 /DNA_END=1734 /DNA_ORIENTATION=+